MKLRYCLALVLVCGVGCGKPKQEFNIDVSFLKTSGAATAHPIKLRPGECAQISGLEFCADSDLPSYSCVQSPLDSFVIQPSEPLRKP